MRFNSVVGFQNLVSGGTLQKPCPAWHCAAMDGLCTVNDLISQQYAQSFWFVIFIVSTLLAGVAVFAWLWRAQAKIQALEEAMRLQVKALEEAKRLQTLSVKVNAFRRKITTEGKEPRPLTPSRSPTVAVRPIAGARSADPNAALSPIARTRSAGSNTRPRQTGIVPFRTQAENVLSNNAGHYTTDASFKQDQHFNRLKPAGARLLRQQESFSRSFSGLASTSKISLPAAA